MPKQFYLSDIKLKEIKKNIIHYPYIMEFAKIVLYEMNNDLFKLPTDDEAIQYINWIIDERVLYRLVKNKYRNKYLRDNIEKTAFTDDIIMMIELQTEILFDVEFYVSSMVKTKDKYVIKGDKVEKVDEYYNIYYDYVRKIESLKIEIKDKDDLIYNIYYNIIKDKDLMKKMITKILFFDMIENYTNNTKVLILDDPRNFNYEKMTKKIEEMILKSVNYKKILLLTNYKPFPSVKEKKELYARNIPFLLSLNEYKNQEYFQRKHMKSSKNNIADMMYNVFTYYNNLAYEYVLEFIVSLKPKKRNINFLDDIMNIKNISNENDLDQEDDDEDDDYNY